MAGQVNIPGIGGVDKRVAYGIGAATTVAIGYIYWRRRNAPPADPGTAAFDEGDLLDTGEYGGGAGWQYAPNPQGDVAGGYTGAEGVPRTNADWTKQAVEFLSSVGKDAGAAADAIGAWLGGQKLTTDQALLVRTAKGGIGKEPEGDHEIIIDSATATPTVVKPGRPTPGIRSASRASLTVGWAPVPGATSYEVKPPYGPASTQTGTSITIGDLKRNVRYTIYVTAINSAGRSATASVTGRTTP